MAKYTKEFGKKVFSADTKKNAYLKACKWYASNILAKDEMQHILVEFIKDEHLPTVTIRLSISIEEKELKEQHCEICKQMHKSFFISEETNCDWCKIAAYQRRSEQKIATKVSYYRELVRRGYE